jgi:hypothetical protein
MKNRSEVEPKSPIIRLSSVNFLPSERPFAPNCNSYTYILLTAGRLCRY